MNDDITQPAENHQATAANTEAAGGAADEEISLRPEDELRLLKDRAKTLGIPISGNIGIDTLK